MATNFFPVSSRLRLKIPRDDFQTPIGIPRERENILAVERKKRNWNNRRKEGRGGEGTRNRDGEEELADKREHFVRVNARKLGE